MEKVLLEKQQLVGEWPNKLDALKELDKRKALILDEILVKEYHRLKTGLAGEQIVLDYIEAFGEKH